jgi:glycine/serine hydroxymethyltransferase
MVESDMARIAELIVEVLRAKGTDSVISSVREQVKRLCSAFPLAA